MGLCACLWLRSLYYPTQLPVIPSHLPFFAMMVSVRSPFICPFTYSQSPKLIQLMAPVFVQLSSTISYSKCLITQSRKYFFLPSHSYVSIQNKNVATLCSAQTLQRTRQHLKNTQFIQCHFKDLMLLFMSSFFDYTTSTPWEWKSDLFIQWFDWMTLP